MSATPELWPSVERPLAQARYFVLLASPEAAGSNWVDREVRWWRENRSRDRFLIALTGGELQWDEAAGDFTSGAAIAPGLRNWFSTEPLWVDLRWAAEERDVSLRNPRFRDSVANLAAPIRGLPKDELIGEDISQHRRTLRLARGAVALLVLLLAVAVVGGVVALLQRNNARNQSELAIAGQVSATGVANLEDRLDIAQLLAAEGHSRRETPQTAAALFEASTASPHLAHFADLGTRVTALSPSAAREEVFAGGRDGTVRSWSVGRDRLGPPLVDLGRPISALQASENGRYLAVGNEAGSVSVVDLRDSSVSRLALDGPVDAVAVTDDGRWLAAASDGFQLSLHDVQHGKVGAEVRVDTEVAALALRDDGLTLIVGGATGSAELRWLPTLEPLGEPVVHSTPAGWYTPAYSPNGRYFGFYKFGVWVWNTDAQDRKLEFPITSSGEATAVAIAPDASLTAVATEGAISVVEPRRRGRGPYSIGAQPGGLVTEPMTGISGRTQFLAFLRSGRRLVSSSGSLLALWDLDQDSRIARALPVPLPDTATASSPPGFSIAGAGPVVAWTSEEPEVGVWDPETGRRTLPIGDGFEQYGAAALSRDGAHLAAVGVDGIEVWDLDRSTGPVSVPSSDEQASSVHALEPDSSSDSMLVIWDNGRIDRLSLKSARLRRLARPPGDSTYMNDVAVAPKADLAFVVIDGHMSKIDLATGRINAGPKLGLQATSAVALSGNGRMLAAADGEESVVLWDLHRERAVRRIIVGRVLHIAFDADARLMATLTGEGLLGVWDVRSGTKLGQVPLPEQRETISPDRGVETALRFAPDGDLWTATTGGRVIRWAMSPRAWARSVCRTVNRSLTEGEWERYIGTSGSPEFSCTNTQPGS